jgi:hypothetical protein
MSLHAVSDGFLAVRVAQGDGCAFAELARRYRPLILHVTRQYTPGLEFQDARQEAVVALYQACLKYDPERGRFQGWPISGCAPRCATRASTPVVQVGGCLLMPISDGDEPTRQLGERAAAPAGTDPACVTVLREELCEHARRVQRQAEGRAGTGGAATAMSRSRARWR